MEISEVTKLQYLKQKFCWIGSTANKTLKEKFSELEDLSIKTTQNETQREKEPNKNELSLRDLMGQ